MGAMKDLYIQRDEWATTLKMELDENVTICEIENLEWFRVTLDDGIIITKIDTSLFIEDGINDWLEVILTDEDAAAQRDAIISSIRSNK